VKSLKLDVPSLGDGDICAWIREVKAMDSPGDLFRRDEIPDRGLLRLQRIHERRMKEDPGHCAVVCFCCCADCDEDYARTEGRG
jgi:hypothetical protein